MLQTYRQMDFLIATDHRMLLNFVVALVPKIGQQYCRNLLAMIRMDYLQQHLHRVVSQLSIAALKIDQILGTKIKY